MTTNQNLLDIVYQEGVRGDTTGGLYRRMQDEDLFLVAYQNLHPNKGALTKGVDPKDTVDGMSLKHITEIIADLEANNYRWTPVRRVYIGKKTGDSLRPLGIPGWKDKMVQEVARMILEAHYEPQFSDWSHGYRPERGCHTALKQIGRVWKGTKWFIELDIRGCFDNIDHWVLRNILAQNIKDNRFLKLIHGMMKAGYIENWEYHNTHSGTPQGGVISPILANIMLNELDKFMENELLPEYNKGERSRNPELQKLNDQIRKAKRNGDREEYKALRRERKERNIPSYLDTPDYRRLRYCRYADDVLLGFAGPRKEAEEIKQATGNFLDTIKLEMSEGKTLITHASTGRARFLGYDIKTNPPNKTGKVTTNYYVKLLVPTDVKKQWLDKYMKNNRPIYRAELLNLSDFEIVQTYGNELRGIVNYYSLAENVGGMFNYVKHMAIRSAARTLAYKHKTSEAKMLKKYSRRSEYGVKALIVEVENPKNPDKPLKAQLGEKPLARKNTTIQDVIPTWKPEYERTELTTRLLADECELCGSTIDVEVHHIRKLADLKKRYGKNNVPRWVRIMSQRNRKQLVVCWDCHQKITAGKYDGTKVE